MLMNLLSIPTLFQVERTKRSTITSSFKNLDATPSLKNSSRESKNTQAKKLIIILKEESSFHIEILMPFWLHARLISKNMIDLEIQLYLLSICIQEEDLHHKPFILGICFLSSSANTCKKLSTFLLSFRLLMMRNISIRKEET